MPDTPPVLDQLYATICQRRHTAPAGSYTARLFAEGRARIAQKVGEEALEVALASVQGQDDRVVYESADLLYHLLVLLADHGIAPDIVYEELERRMKP